MEFGVGSDDGKTFNLTINGKTVHTADSPEVFVKDLLSFAAYLSTTTIEIIEHSRTQS